MESIWRLVRRSVWRLGLDQASQVFARVLVVVVVGVTLAIVADRLFFLHLPLFYLLSALVGAGVLAAGVLSRRRWPTALGAAIEIDRRLLLSERISSAVAVAGSTEDMARAVVEDARSFAAGVPLARTFPLRFHREYWGALALVPVAVGLFLWLPQYDLFARRATEEHAKSEQEAVRKEAERLARELTALRKQVEVQGPAEALAHLERMEEVVKQMEHGKMSRPEALAELGRLADALREAHQELSRKELASKELFQQRGLAETKGLLEALAQKNFQAAAEELKKLAERVRAGKQQNQEELEKLKEQLRQLAEKLKEKGAGDMANQAKELAEKAGGKKLSPEELAKLQEALAKLAQQLGERDMGALAEELKKSSQQLGAAEDRRAALEQLGRELAELANAFPDRGGLGEKLARLADQVSAGDAESLALALKDAVLEFDAQAQLEGELAVLATCAGLCEDGERGLAGRLATWGGTGIYSPGDSRRAGPGMGGPGIGAGGVAPVRPEDVALEPTKIKGEVKPGRVVGSYFTDGVQLKGDAQAEYRETVAGAAQEAADAIDKEEIPRAYSQYVRQYFEEMRKE